MFTGLSQPLGNVEPGAHWYAPIITANRKWVSFSAVGLTVNRLCTHLLPSYAQHCPRPPHPASLTCSDTAVLRFTQYEHVVRDGSNDVFFWVWMKENYLCLDFEKRQATDRCFSVSVSWPTKEKCFCLHLFTALPQHEHHSEVSFRSYLCLFCVSIWTKVVASTAEWALSFQHHNCCHRCRKKKSIDLLYHASHMSTRKIQSPSHP